MAPQFFALAEREIFQLSLPRSSAIPFLRIAATPVSLPEPSVASNADSTPSLRGSNDGISIAFLHGVFSAEQSDESLHKRWSHDVVAAERSTRMAAATRSAFRKAAICWESCACPSGTIALISFTQRGRSQSVSSIDSRTGWAMTPSSTAHSFQKSCSFPFRSIGRSISAEVLISASLFQPTSCCIELSEESRSSPPTTAESPVSVPEAYGGADDSKNIVAQQPHFDVPSIGSQGRRYPSGLAGVIL